jgi:hypothetical protein
LFWRSTAWQQYAENADNASVWQLMCDMLVPSGLGLETSMASRLRIRCINKIPREDPHRSITHVGGGSVGNVWKQTQQQTIAEIEAGTYEYYVSVAGKEVEVIVATHNGHKYIKTTADGVGPNNLLSLPERPNLAD